MSIGKVILIGAGCGDFDLISLRGIERLKRCDCVIYDALIDERLLDFAPESAEKICVGKRSGKHSETQENINRLLIEKALEGLTVARLKGGDPFVFGRGGEEILALKEYKIPYSIVPGITSSVAVPELAGIPVTHRKISRSFHVITGHTADDLRPENIGEYARLGGTLVFLMGLRNLEKIAKALIENGMPPDTPAAVISNGAKANQRAVRAALCDISQKCEAEKIEPPAVIVVGKTAAFDFSAVPYLPLDGVKIGVTGTKRFSEKLTVQLRELGADVHTADFLDVRETERAQESAAAKNFDWLVFTSINGAEIFFENMRWQKTDIREFSHVKFAVIGSGTKKVLTNRGIYPDLMPESYTSAELGRSLAENVKPQEKVMIYRAENGSAELTEILDSKGICYSDVKAYSVSDNGKAFPHFAQCRFVTFASASGVNAYFDRGMKLPENALAICIGEITAKALAARGVTGFRVAHTQNASGIAEIILEETKK